MARKLFALWGSVFLSMLLAACGGDSSPTSSPPPIPSPPPAQTGALEVHVTDPYGGPVPYADVVVRSRTGSGALLSAYTDGAGIAAFSALPSGSVSAFASVWPYRASSEELQVEVQTGARAHLELMLEAPYAGAAAVLATRRIGGETDGTEIEFEADIAVVDPSGRPIEGIDASQVTLPPWDCGGWDGPCIVDDAGQDVGRWAPVTAMPTALEWLPGSPPSPYAAGLLVDQGTYIDLDSWDPGRKNAIAEFLDLFDPANSVALAEFRWPQGQPFAVRYDGGFVSDAALLRDAVLSLDQRVGGSSPVDLAVPEMLRAMHDMHPTQAAALVLVAPGGPGWQNDWVQSVLEASEATGIPVNLIGQSGFAASAAVARSGGTYFYASFPARVRTALLALDSVLSGSIPFYRARFRLQLDAPVSSDQPRTLYTSVYIVLAEGVTDRYLWVPLAVRLSPATLSP